MTNLTSRSGGQVLPDLKVIADRASSDLSLLKNLNRDVVLLDLGLHNGNSLAVAKAVRVGFPQSRITLMDLIRVHEDIVEFIHAGVARLYHEGCHSRRFGEYHPGGGNGSQRVV